MEQTDRINTSAASRQRPGRKRLWIIICVAVVVLGSLFFTGLAYVSAGYAGEEPVRINLPEGTSPEQLRDSLTSQLGGIGGRIYWMWSVFDHVPPHGSYLIKPGIPAYRIARMIARGKESPVRLTFNNLRTVPQLAARAAKIMECDSADFMAAVDSVLPQYGFDGYTAPAAFIPDTYEFYWTESPGRLVRKLVERRNDFWNETRRNAAKKIGLTPVQVATVASIAEEETGKADERPIVARLYLNRLAKGMKLQADPTVKFATGDFSLRRILGKHLAIESPYNTYRVNGLPPGPIRIADMSAIEAVLEAPCHEYLYMCAREDFSGYHNFARDYALHLANARRYQAALDRKGIR